MLNGAIIVLATPIIVGLILIALLNARKDNQNKPIKKQKHCA